MPAVFFYISGHGFGHASRQIEIINALGETAPEVTIIVRTSAPAWLFHRTARVPLTLLPGACDTGVAQIDSLRLDERATVEEAAAFHRELPRRATDEATLLRQLDARLVIADAPPLACAAAAEAGVSSVVVSNFTWDWIYAGYPEHLQESPDLVPALAGAYSLARAGWRLPMHGGFESVAGVVDVPFVARHARHERADVRRRLGLPADRPLVLSSFGGYGVDGLHLTALDCLDSYGIVITRRDQESRPLVAGVYPVEENRLYAAGLRYEDLVAAVDVVVTKPGYGIIAECVANRAAMLYTSRGRFREYEVLTAALPDLVRCCFLDHPALFSGRWRASLDLVLSAQAPPLRPATDGALVVAELIRGML